MAVAYDAASESHTGTSGSISEASFSWTHTIAGTARGVLVYVYCTGTTTNQATSVTYGGETLTEVSGGTAADTAGETGTCVAYFLGTGIPSGNQTVTVNRNNNSTGMYAAAFTVTAANDTEVYTTGIVLDQNDGTLAERSVDDGTPGTNSLRFGGLNSGLPDVPSAGANSTAGPSIDVGARVIANVYETTAGQGSRPVGFSSGTTDDRAGVYLAVREVAGGGATHTLTADGASFTFSGQDVGLLAARVIAADSGSFALAGQDAGLRAARVLAADSGAFTLSGQDVTLTYTPSGVTYTMTAESGAFTLAGQDVALRAARILTADSGAFALAGQDVTLTYTPGATYTLVAESGAFTLAGQDVAFGRSYVLTADSASFVLTGQPVVLVYSPPAGDAFIGGGGWGVTHSQAQRLLDRLKKKDARSSMPTRSNLSSICWTPCRKKSKPIRSSLRCSSSRMGRGAKLMSVSHSARPKLSSASCVSTKPISVN